jgi:dTMP kinase
MFVTFEGPEGAGKSSVLKLVADRLVEEGVDHILTREPGGSPIGPQIRGILLESQELGHLAELFLFLADRAEHVRGVIEPALERGEVVLCDRFSDSTVVYQGYGRGIDLELLRKLNGVATRGLKPHLTILLDIDPSLGLQRISEKDRLDREPLEFHEKVREGFLDEARLEPDRWMVIDASQPLEKVAEEAAHIVTLWLHAHQEG